MTKGGKRSAARGELGPEARLLNDAGDALSNLASAVADWMEPFLKRWATTGSEPRPSAATQSAICRWVDAHALKHKPHPGYGWLPALLKELAPSLRFNRRNFMNIHPSPYVPAVIANAIVSIQNPNNIVPDASPATWKLEEWCVKWMADHLLGFPEESSWGNVVGGGTIANMTALLVARDYCYGKLARPGDAGVRERGLFGRPPGVVLATAGSHYSIRKALWLLGMGDENVIDIPVAFDHRVAAKNNRDQAFVTGITSGDWGGLIKKAIDKDIAAGKRELRNFYRGKQAPFSLQPLQSEIFKALYSCFTYGKPLIAYVFTVGTTDTGTVEQPEGAALERLWKEDVYIHADCASGGFALLHDRVKKLTKGLEMVNSATVDGHKLGFLPYPNGAVVFKNKGWAHEIIHSAPYLSKLAPTLEGSRPGTHVAALWAILNDLGETGLRQWHDQLFAFMDALKAAFEASGAFQILHDVHLTTIAVAPLPQERESRREINELVVRLHQQIAADTSTDAYLVNIDRGLSGIKVRNDNVFGEDLAEHGELVDIFCLRIVAANPQMTADDADGLVKYLTKSLSRARRCQTFTEPRPPKAER
jgi:glutamate/tyrosine decarboxylase-like PLP-dependent enzyme